MEAEIRRMIAEAEQDIERRHDVDHAYGRLSALQRVLELLEP